MIVNVWDHVKHHLWKRHSQNLFIRFFFSSIAYVGSAVCRPLQNNNSSFQSEEMSSLFCHHLCKYYYYVGIQKMIDVLQISYIWEKKSAKWQICCTHGYMESGIKNILRFLWCLLQTNQWSTKPGNTEASVFWTENKVHLLFHQFFSMLLYF